MSANLSQNKRHSVVHLVSDLDRRAYDAPDVRCKYRSTLASPPWRYRMGGIMRRYRAHRTGAARGRDGGLAKSALVELTNSLRKTGLGRGRFFVIFVIFY